MKHDACWHSLTVRRLCGVHCSGGRLPGGGNCSVPAVYDPRRRRRAIQAPRRIRLASHATHCISKQMGIRAADHTSVSAVNVCFQKTLWQHVLSSCITCMNAQRLGRVSAHIRMCVDCFSVNSGDCCQGKFPRALNSILRGSVLGLRISIFKIRRSHDTPRRCCTIERIVCQKGCAGLGWREQPAVSTSAALIILLGETVQAVSRCDMLAHNCGFRYQAESVGSMKSCFAVPR